MTKNQAILELIFAALIWGFGFIATVWAFPSFGPLTITFIRFVLGFILIYPFLFWIKSVRPKNHLQLFKLSAVPGLMLSVVLIFQTWGLKYTTATRSGFITTLYIIFVPIFENIFLKKHVNKKHWFYVFTALVGTALISNLQSGDWTIGDLLTLCCAIVAAVQIVYIGAIVDRVDSALAFNTYQCFWAMLPPLLLLTFIREPIAPVQFVAAFGLAWLVFGSTILGFMFQVRAQKVLSPSLSSLLFLLESPFACIFALVFLGERLIWSQWMGGAMILAAAVAVVLNSPRSRSSEVT